MLKSFYKLFFEIYIFNDFLSINIRKIPFSTEISQSVCMHAYMCGDFLFGILNFCKQIHLSLSLFTFLGQTTCEKSISSVSKIFKNAFFDCIFFYLTYLDSFSNYKISVRTFYLAGYLADIQLGNL